MFQLLLKWFFPWVREGLQKISLDKFAPPLSVPFRSQKLSLEHGCHFSRLTLLSNEWPYYILFGISLSTSVGPLVRTSSLFLNIPPKDRIPLSVVSRVHKAKTCSQKIIRERLRVSGGELVMKPGELQMADLLFHFWGWRGPSRDPDPWACIVKQYGGRGRRIVYLWWWWGNTKWLHGNSEPGK